MSALYESLERYLSTATKSPVEAAREWLLYEAPVRVLSKRYKEKLRLTP